ncbi:uncharacterized protein LOC111700540 isoform X1 [Eurytemora carolleeae]|uniref:uncharacterized protein LOC111700540 isoform X1 n=1 Tax=Eurytemora carolleeae TaxID=1294199 RepID=UPI000C77633F|nr:uncharacterized protein LOC111700540 isoform X1 [Eurytemora carolleeae]|eukprot:XP_023327264.1 uncharacterized protein LOC111700540 isoform X1 [Eurytemora affinis]
MLWLQPIWVINPLPFTQLRMMKLISLLVVAATALADVQQVETEQQFVQGVQSVQAERAPEPAQYYYPPQQQYQPYSNQFQHRNGDVGVHAGITDIAGSYASGIIVTLLIVTVVILVMDLVFSNYNIVETIMGRSAKKLWEEGSSGLMSNLNTLNLIETANEVYSAVEKYNNLNVPRSF